MKIIIAGAGSVGTHLARMLSNEAFNIVLIDESESKLSKVNELDIMTLCASPTSIKGLENADVEHADLFIAVTPHESENIMCCMLAKQLGAKRTVARIDNYEYLKPEHQELFERMGISSLIYPEMLAGQEIAESIQLSWARQWWRFNDGELVLVCVKMHQAGILINKTLKELNKEHHLFHVVAIKRNGETIIPRGDDCIYVNDLVFFMTKREDVDLVRIQTGKENYPPVKHAVIVGGGKLSVRTSWAIPNNINLKIIESDEARCEKLCEIVKDGVMIIQGDGHDMGLLYDEGLNHVEAFISLTDNDEENILACVTARKKGVRKTIAQIENSDYFDMAEDLDIGTIINKKTIAASHIYKMLLQADVDNVKMLNVADADVAEFIVKEGSKVTQDSVMELGLPKGVNFGGLIRDGKGMLVSGRTVLRPGDKVVVFCLASTLKKLDKYFR